MSESEKRGQVTEELKQIYADARAEGIWLYEMGPMTEGGDFTAGAGRISDLEAIERARGVEIDISKISLFDAMHLTMPGGGPTREAACRNAIAALKRHEAEEAADPDDERE